MPGSLPDVQERAVTNNDEHPGSKGIRGVAGNVWLTVFWLTVFG
jgi:hypothetical protein